MIIVSRENTLRSRGSLVPFYWSYHCVGPDGTRFDNSSIVALRQVLRRKYGRDIVIVESWKLIDKVIAENSHAVRDRVRILRTEIFEHPFEGGTNVGEIELELNSIGNRAIYGVYVKGPQFQCFAN